MSRNSFLNRRGKSEWIYISGKVCNTVLVDMIILTDFLNITSMKNWFCIRHRRLLLSRFQIKFQAYLVHNGWKSYSLLSLYGFHQNAWFLQAYS